MAGDRHGVDGAMQCCRLGLLWLALALVACSSGHAGLSGDGPALASREHSHGPKADAGLDAARRAPLDAGVADAASAAPARRLPRAVEARIDAVVEGAMARGEVPGAVILVVQRDQVVLRKAYGKRSLKPASIAMTLDTVFDLASLTKPIVTATAIALLVERGQLSWTHPVGRYLSSFAAGDKRAVTVEQLLRHTSGLPPGIGLLEATNLSVGRGTNRPFEQLGAPWLDGQALADELQAAGLPGIRFAPVEFTPASSVFAGKRCHGVAFELSDPQAFRAVRTGIEIAHQLRQAYPRKWRAHRVGMLLGNAHALRALLAGRPPKRIVARWQPELAAFRQRRQAFLLYGAAQ